MNKKWIVLVASLLMLVVGIPTLAQDGEIKTTWTCPAGFEGQSLNVYNWSTYVAPDTISNFEKLCGVRVTYDVYGGNDELLSRMRQGNPGYDIIVPSDFTLEIMVGEELVQPLDHSLIPNIANLSAQFVDPPFDPGNTYSVVYQWGTMGLGYNFTAVGEEITSWKQFFDYAGPVAWLEAKREMLGFAALVMGIDPNTTDLDEINQLKQFLIEKGGNVSYIAPDEGQELLARGEVHMAVEYMGDIFQIIAACEEDPNCSQDYRYIVPEEGSNIWADNLAIPVGALNVPLAHAFIDYILDPQVGADISNFTAYATPNQAAIDQGLIDEEMLNNPGIYPDEAKLERLFWVAENADVEQAYADAWDEVKIRLGN